MPGLAAAFTVLGQAVSASRGAGCANGLNPNSTIEGFGHFCLRSSTTSGSTTPVSGRIIEGLRKAGLLNKRKVGDPRVAASFREDRAWPLGGPRRRLEPKSPLASEQRTCGEHVDGN